MSGFAQQQKPFVNLGRFMSLDNNKDHLNIGSVYKTAQAPRTSPVEQHKQAEASAKAATKKALELEDIAEKHTLAKKKTKLATQVAQHTQEHQKAKTAHSQLEIQLKSARKLDDSKDHSKLQDAVTAAEAKTKDIKDKKDKKENALQSLQAGGRRRRTRRKRRKSKHRRHKRHTKKRRRSPKKRRRSLKKRRKRHTKKRRRSRRR
jgi:hypothetical protein